MSFESAGRQTSRAALGFACLSLALSLGTGRVGYAQTNISTPAYQLIDNRAAADQANFYVYLDQDSGFNHGFPSGFMGTDQSTIALNAGCIDSSISPTGCSSDPTALDRVHGTVLSISFAAQPTGNWAGIALEEPQGWLALQYGTGYNLTGATGITFNVRSPNGAQVQFGVGGCTTPFTAPISSNWTTMTLSLSTSSLSCNPTLSDVNLLFEIVTNDAHDPQGATVLLDNIQFTPVPTAQAAALSFPLANQTFGVVPQQAPPIPSDQVLRNTTTIYESSLAEYALLARGTPQDLQNAELIANTFDYALHHESHGDPIPVAPGGYSALHNGYENGDIGLYNNQPPPLLGQAGDIRLAGFTDTSLCAPSGYCLVLDGATGGNNAFAIVALVDAYRQFGNYNYLNDALGIGDWIVANLTDTSGTGYGGYYVGYGDEGIPPPKPIETGKSIENNADIFAAFTALANIESQLGNQTAAASWTTAANVAGDFVMQMYDPVHGRFNVGTSPVGTPPSPGTCPTGAIKGNDVINVCDFLDSNTFTTLAMAAAPRYKSQINWRLPIQYVLNTFAQSVTAAGNTYEGFDIVPTPDSGANGVAWEFTGQTVEAMNFVDQLYNVTTFQSQAGTYLNEIALAQSSAPFTDGLGLVASTLQGGDTLTPVNQCLSTPYQCIAERVGLAATSWGILAEKQLNYYKFLLAPSTTLLTSSAIPSSSGQSVTFTAEVMGPYNDVPTGTVSFYRGTTLLGTVAMSGVWAYYTTSTLPIGSDAITAIYSGDVNYAVSTSNVVSQVVTAAPLGPQGYTYSVLYSFLTNSPDGSSPIGNVVRDASGNMYGATEFGANAGGTVYKLTSAGKETLLYQFAPGSLPYSGLIADSAGNLYGTTEFSASSGPGSVYKVTPSGVGTLLYNFTGGADGGYPEAGLVEDSSANLYGTTLMGGANGWGGVFKLTSAGVESVLHSFTGQQQPPDGGDSVSDLVRDSSGNLYGTSLAGGASGFGTVFQLSSSGAETLRYSFTGGADGSQPNAGVVRDAAGNLYGATAHGGNAQCTVGGTTGCGVLYKLTPAGVQTVLHSFQGGQDGATPMSDLLMDAQGNLFGTTTYGARGNGTVYKVSSSGVETVLYSFGGSPDGAMPFGGLVADAQGDLYGTTFHGGAVGGGTVFKLAPTSLPSTTTTLASSANPSKTGSSVTFTATVTAQFGGVPAGTVTFKYGTITLGSATLSAGVAKLSTTALPKGTDVVTAAYGGSTGYAASSGSMTQTEN